MHNTVTEITKKTIKYSKYIQGTKEKVRIVTRQEDKYYY